MQIIQPSGFTGGMLKIAVGMLLPAALRVFQVMVVTFLIGVALFPLAALLLLFPALYQQENVLTDTIRPAPTYLHAFFRRFLAIVFGLAMFVALLAFGVEIVSHLGLHPSYFGALPKIILPESLITHLPDALIDQWPYVLLVVYATDLIVIFFIGKVPLKYNLRNVAVRWRDSLMTAIAIVVVVALLSVMMAFVTGLSQLTSNSGIPGNIFVLSEGATDELFSNLGYGDAKELGVQWVDVGGHRVSVKEVSQPGKDMKAKLCTFETYFVINHPIPARPGEKPRRRFVQLRGVQDAFIAAKVHNIELKQGGEWFGETGQERMADGTLAIPAVLGEGAASKVADDLRQKELHVGDVFMMADLRMVCKGIMKSEGTTFGSEIWADRKKVGDVFGKTEPTTAVIRVSDDSLEGAQALAQYISKTYNKPRVSAKTEMQYYEDLSKSNEQIFTSVLVVAVIMSIGGTIGIMSTMFAAIAQRTKDIGVLRILGFKRWQILISFMLETLVIAIAGGLLGVAIGSLADGFQMTSNLSSGQGGGKTVILRMIVDSNVIITGILFAIVMGRIGGLVPALSAMRMGILESLR